MTTVDKCVVIFVNIIFISLDFSLAVAPTISNLPNSTSIHEDTSTEISLYTIGASDADGDAITCTFGPGTVPGTGTSKFQVRYISGTSTWCIYTVANAGYDYSTQPSYSLEINCTANSQSVTGTYTVYINQNVAPVINNLPQNVTVPVTSGVGTNIFTVNVTDAEKDQVTLTISCSPATPTCPFDIFDSGALVLNAELSTTTVIGYDVTVGVRDSSGSGISKVLSVLFSGINSPPVITNLNASHTEPENSALGTTVKTVTCTDSDVTDTHVFTMTCTNSGSSYFKINSSTGVITTSSVSNINYEYLLATVGTFFTCTITCNDGTDSSTATLNITVTDVNEAPKFAQNSFSVTANEGAAGTVILTGFDVTDEDAGDTKYFSLDCGSPYTAYFSISTSTGQISFSTKYDVDDGVRPTSVKCFVSVTDSGGLNDTKSLDITINNLNDNAPDFTQSAYVWFISESDPVGTTVGTVTALDADIGLYGKITYSLDLSSLSAEYFSIDQSGVIRIKTSITSYGAGVMPLFYVLATDGGGTETRETVTVIITATTTTTTTTTTDRYKTFFEDGRNIAWFTACCVAVVATAIVIGGMCFSFSGDSTPWCTFRKARVFHNRNWGEGHRDNFKRPEPPPRKIPEPQIPVAGFQFWSEAYRQFD